MDNPETLARLGTHGQSRDIGKIRYAWTIQRHWQDKVPMDNPETLARLGTHGQSRDIGKIRYAWTIQRHWQD